ncbi:hypothetical protein NUU61_000878 [Penicillium alfredii]|uniref:Uncharacterized protein n=1 Tax=Penicillium alfredii TaxID=1506179 RepID=A0A9W9GAE9_9EURO|nr:uncharacterized protein NUU61_000878 [Penicillium alfredii]KAJ5115119.1 hypothetical protein NUU61_000878 [Penicillium alfredii]
MSDSYTSSSYYYSSTTNTTDGTTTTGHRYTTTSHTEPDGTTIVRTAHQDLGQPAVVEERRYDRTGQEELQLALPGPGGTSAGGVRRITDLDDEDTTGATTLDAGTAYGTVGGAGAPQSVDRDMVDRESYDLGTPFGTRVFDPATGAYDEHADYDADGAVRHHRVLRDVGGRRFHRDVDMDSSGLSSSSAREQRQYENPSTGTRLHRETDVDVSELI